MNAEKDHRFNPVVDNQNFQTLMQNQSIHVVAPSSGMELGGLPLIQSLPFLRLNIPDDIIVHQDIPFHAHSDSERFRMLKYALYEAPEPIVWALRGGYGSARLLDELALLEPPEKEKLFIGYSDISALHVFLAQKWGWKTIHGSVVMELLRSHADPENFLRLAALMSGKLSNLTIDHLKPLNEVARNPQKKITGRLTGGNLAMIQTSLGTAWKMQSRGKIIFLEDVGEKGYQVDRMLNHLKQAGVFKTAKAVVLGEFTNPADQHVQWALRRFANEVNIPVYQTDEFGHGRKNYPLMYHSKASITEAVNSSGKEQAFTLKMTW